MRLIKTLSKHHYIVVLVELLIAVIFLFLFSGRLHAQDRTQIHGYIFETETELALPGAHVMIDGTSYGTISGPEGEFRLSVREFPVVLKVTHIGFDDRYFTVNKEIKDETLMLGLNFSAEMLDGVTISDKKAELIFKDETYSVLDFEFHENGLMLLIFRNRLNRAELVLLSNINDTLAVLPDLPGKAESLYRDCRNFILYTSADSAYQVHYTGADLQLIYPLDVETFRPVANSFKAFHDQYYYFAINSFYKQVIDYVRYDTATGEYFPFKTVADKRNLRILSDNPRDAALMGNPVSDEMELELLLQEADGGLVFKKGNNNIAREMTFQAHFLKACVYQPVYAPLFNSEKYLVLFNHPESAIEFLSPDGELVGSTYISHQTLSGWEPLILKDDIFDEYYVVFNTSNRLTLRPIDINTGMLGSPTDMAFTHIKKVQVRNGYAYFTYRQPGTIERTMLFRQKLTDDPSGLLLTGQK